MKFYLYLLIFSLFLFSLVSVGQDLIPFQQSESGLWGYRNQKTGEVVIAPKFEQVGEFSNGKVWVKNSDGAFLIDEKGKIAVSLMSLYLSLLMVSCLSVKDYVASRKGTNGNSSTKRKFLHFLHHPFSWS